MADRADKADALDAEEIRRSFDDRQDTATGGDAIAAAADGEGITTPRRRRRRSAEHDILNAIPSELHMFLEALYAPYAKYAGARIEIRSFKLEWSIARGQKNHSGPRDWFPATAEGFDAAAKSAYKWAADHDVYFGVLPRTHGGGKAADVKVAAWLWADLDAGDETYDEALDLLIESCAAKGLPRPHILVRSGGGLHCYWRILDVTPCATHEQQNRLRDAMRRLVMLIGGDVHHAHACPASTDVARILRLPGTFNHKIEGNPRPVELVRLYANEAARPLVWWEAFLPAIPLPAPYVSAYGYRSGQNWSTGGNRQVGRHGLLPATVQRITHGAPNGRKHYEMVTVATAARKQGLGEDAIRAAAEAFGINAGVNMGDPAQQRHLEGVVRWAVQNVAPEPI